MQPLRLPIGIQSFRNLRENGFHYVDKTELIYQLVSTGYHTFLSRPPMFGKSLLVSTIKELFLGNKELFEGLWIADKWDWKPYPVIHLDFNILAFAEASLDLELSKQLAKTASQYGLQLDITDPKTMLSNLINKFANQKQKVVILVDDFEKPIRHFLEKDIDKAKKNNEVLQDCFAVLKSLENIHFVLLTSVTKIGRPSGFTGLNHLYDISTDAKFGHICGFTQKELENQFADKLDTCAKEMDMAQEEMKFHLRNWYNNYSWEGQEKVYNPYSIVHFLASNRFHFYAYNPNLCRYLARLVKDRQVLPQDLENMLSDYEMLRGDITELDPYTLLFQTGYLTIKSLNGPPTRRTLTLGFPNFEAQNSFLRHLLSEYNHLPLDHLDVDIVAKMKEALKTGNLDTFFKIARSVYASVPYPVFKTQEDYFHALMHVMLTLTGMRVQAEGNQHWPHRQCTGYRQQDLYF